MSEILETKIYPPKPSLSNAVSTNNYKVGIEVKEDGTELIYVVKKLKETGPYNWLGHEIRADLLFECLSNRKGIMRDTPINLSECEGENL